jgi:hypothetical protein
MNSVDVRPERGNRAATSVRQNSIPRETLTSAPANDGPALDACAEAAVDAAVAATVPMLRAHLRRELAERLPYLRAEAPARRERIGLRPGDDAPVDDTARARARALLDRHSTPRGRR